MCDTLDELVQQACQLPPDKQREFLGRVRVQDPEMAQALRRRLVELHESESDLSGENPSADSSSGTTSPEEAASEGPEEPSTNGSSTNGSAAPTEPIPSADIPTIPHEEDDSDDAPSRDVSSGDASSEEDSGKRESEPEREDAETGEGSGEGAASTEPMPGYDWLPFPEEETDFRENLSLGDSSEPSSVEEVSSGPDSSPDVVDSESTEKEDATGRDPASRLSDTATDPDVETESGGSPDDGREEARPGKASPEDRGAPERTLTQEAPVGTTPPQSGASRSTEELGRAGSYPERVGPWRLKQKLGRGGMGTVYLAERADGQFQQRAALKLIRHDLGEEAQQRFLSERQILAELKHPNIAHLLDGGLTDDGRPYFAMEYVEGVPIDEYCYRNELGIETRLRLFRQVCEAVQFAHRNLIVHRDLKPSNVLVTEPGTTTAGDGAPAGSSTGAGARGSGPQVKLLDFGIAKALEGAETDVVRTETGEGSPMTPAYAAPEQVEGKAVTTATDVYALGALLCELLSGSLPYDVKGRPMVEAAQIISEEKPTAPSDLVVEKGHTHVTDATDHSPETLQKRLEGDLDVIVGKALRKEPDRRYGSVGDLGQDIGRHLEGLPVEARPATTGYRLRRFVERNRAAVLSGLGAVLALILGLGVAIWQAQVASTERDRAQQNAERAEAVQTFLVDMIGRAAPAATGGEELTMREVLDEAEAEIEAGTVQDQPEVTIEVRLTMADMYNLLDRYEAAAEQSRKAYETSVHVLGPDHPQTLKAAGTFGTALFDNGNVEKADSLFQTVVPQLEEAEPDPESHSFLLTRYGKVLMELNRLGRADTLLHRALDLHERRAEMDTIELTRTLLTLGNVYREQGRLDVEGADYDSEERYRLAEEKLQRALTLSEKLDASEQKLLEEEVVNNLAILYGRMEKYDLQETMYRRTLRLAKTLYGEESSAVARALTDLSRFLRDHGRLREADRLSARALELHRKLFPPSDHRIGFAAFARANVLREQGRYEEASELLEEARDLFAEKLGPTHPHTATMHGVLVEMYLNLEDLKAAGRHAQAALEAYGARLDSTDRRIVMVKSRLGEVRTQQRRYQEAEELLLGAFDVQKTQGADESEIESTRQRLVELYEAWNRPDEAQRWREEN